MDVLLNTQNLIDDIGARYLMESGSSDPIPPRGVLIQCLNESDARLTGVIGRFLEPSYKSTAKDDLRKVDSYKYRLMLSPRKAAGKAQAIADLLHSFLVNSTLAKCYYNANAKDLAEKREQQAVNDAQALNQLLRSKQPPM